ncbi:MAG: capsular biosynthesis protein [Pseudomonadota bacterium]
MSTIERAIQKLGRTAQSPQDGSTLDDVPSITVPEPGPAPLRDEEAMPPEFAMAAPGDSERDNEESSSRIQLDYDYMASLGMVTPDGERNQVAEEYRHIKRPLLLNAFGEGALSHTNRNLIMVCSARPHEGKTFTAINLALSIALERDRTVLLVDADVAKPSVARVLNFPGTAGLVDFLADPHRLLADLILQTNMPKLRILPAGRRHSHSTELLGSDGMQTLAQELAAILKRGR